MKTVGSQSLWPSRLTKMYRNLYTLAINGRVSNSSKNAKYKNRKQNNGRSRRPSAKRQRATRTEACGIFSACFNFGLPLSPTMSCTEERVYNPSRSRFREEKKLDRPRIAIRWICDGGWKRKGNLEENHRKRNERQRMDMGQPDHLYPEMHVVTKL